MTRSFRFPAFVLAALLAAALGLPAAVGASSPSSATLTMLNASCSGAPGTIAVGDTVCARAVVNVASTGAESYRTYWFGPGALTATFQDVHPLSGSGSMTFEDAHQLTTPGIWTVRACKNAACVAANAIMATKAFNVSGTVAAAPTSLAVSPATGTFGGTTTLSAALVTTSGGAPVTNATVAFTLSGTAVGSAMTDGTGVATLAGVALNGTGAGSYPSAVGASFAGGTGLAAASATGSLGVARASSSTSVDCPASVTYSGDAQAPCTASVTGAGGLDQPVGIGYSANTDAGTATADATFGGDANHDPSSASATFTIDPAGSTVALTCPAELGYTGAAQTPCSASVTGAGGLDEPLDVAYTGNVLGTATASATFDGDANHTGSTASTTFDITFAWFGFDDPVEAGKGYKAGRTIPLKFAIGDGSGQVVQQLGSPVFGRSDSLGACDSTPVAATAPAATPDGGAPFKWTGGQYHYNWSTRGLAPGLYRLFAGLADGTLRHVDVCLSR